MECMRSRTACAARAQSKPRGPTLDAAALPTDAGAAGHIVGCVGPVRAQPIHSTGNQPMMTFVIAGTACTWHVGAAPTLHHEPQRGGRPWNACVVRA
jgi:hypothetical protein